jgi:hypothetical protein
MMGQVTRYFAIETLQAYHIERIKQGRIAQ